MRYALLLLLLLLPSCTNLGQAIRDGREIVNDLRETYEDLRPVVEDIVEDVEEVADLFREEMSSIQDDFRALDAQAFAQADKDGDGKLDLLERLAYYLLIGGGAAEIGRRKLKALRERDRARAEAAAANSASVGVGPAEVP